MFHDAAVEFLADGLRRCQRLIYLGSEDPREVRDGLAPLGDVDGLIDSGTLELRPVSEIYGGGVDSDVRLAAVAAATEQALADGYSGLRVAVQGTDLVCDEATFGEHLRWESLIDRYMSSHPFAALCGYDRLRIPSEVGAYLRAIHPASNPTGEPTPFRLFFTEPGTMMVQGEIDYFSAEVFDRLLDVAVPDDGVTVLDLDGLGFIDHHALRALARHTAARGRETFVRRLPYSAQRLCDLMGTSL